MSERALPIASGPSLAVRAAVRLRRLALPSYLVLLAAFLLSPVIVVMGTALTASLFPRFPPDGLSLQWLREAVERREFVESFWISIRIAVVVTLVAIVVGTATAIGLLRMRARARAAFSVVFLSPLMFPNIVIGIGLLQWFIYLGVVRSQSTIVAGHLVVALPFVVRLVIASLLGHADLEERAARSLGASSLRAFFAVTLPNIRAGLIGAGTFAFIVSFADVNLSVFLSSIRVQTLPITLMAYVETEPDPIGAAVSAWIVLIGITALFVIDRVVGLRSLSGRGGEAEVR